MRAGRTRGDPETGERVLEGGPSQGKSRTGIEVPLDPSALFLERRVEARTQRETGEANAAGGRAPEADRTPTGCSGLCRAAPG